MMNYNRIPRSVALIALLCVMFGAVASNAEPCDGVRDGYFVRDKNDCKGYYYCSGGISTRNYCPLDFYFNELTQACDYADKVTCHICQQQFGVQVSAHPQNCNQFIMCSEGLSSVGQCADGYLFDDKLRTCNPTQRVTCNVNRCPEQDNPNHIVYLPGVVSCEEYFICQSGMAVQKFCAPGLRWDAILERCDFSQNVACTL